MTQQRYDRLLSWMPLGKGSFNTAFVSNENVTMGNFSGKIVKKIPQDIHEKCSNVDRLLRKFHEIYPQFQGTVEKIQPYVFKLQKPPTSDRSIKKEVVYLFESSPSQLGIVFKTSENILHVKNTSQTHIILSESLKERLLTCIRQRKQLTQALKNDLINELKLDKHSFYLPFLGQQIPTDEEIQQEILNIYLRTRNIVVDGCGQGNFKKQDGEVFCVDYDYAVRRDSIVSQEYFFNAPDIRAQFETYWSVYEQPDKRPKSTQLIRTLVYIEQHLRADEITDDLITLEILNKLHSLRERSYPITRQDLILIKNIIEVCGDQIQCIHAFMPTFLDLMRPFISLEEFPSMVHDTLLSFMSISDVVYTDDNDNNDTDETNLSALSPR